MDYYYLKQYPEETREGAHSEVHREGCPCLNGATHTIYLGYFCSCQDAISHAKRIYPYIADMCSECCPEYK